MTAEARYIVCVRDEINGELADHLGCAYRSPPQTEADALALVALLLGGRPPRVLPAPATWTVAGRRRPPHHRARSDLTDRGTRSTRARRDPVVPFDSPDSPVEGSECIAAGPWTSDIDQHSL